MIPILEVSKFCKNLNFANFGDVGTCLTELTTFGDASLMAIVVLLLFSGLLYKASFPGSAVIPMGLAILYALWLMSYSATEFLVLFLIALMVAGAVFIVAILNYIRK